MIENIKITVMGEEKEVSKNTTYLELSRMYQSNFENPIIIAKQNGSYKELRDKVTSDGNIEFCDYNDREANRVYLNGLVYLTIYAFKDLYNGKIRVKHSIDKGLYIETNIEINEENYFSENFSDTYFSSKDCKKIGYIRDNIEDKFKKQEINEREKCILIASLIYSMDRVANTVGHYDAYRKIKNIKDITAAFVFVMSSFAFVIGLIIFAPKILALIIGG